MYGRLIPLPRMCWWQRIANLFRRNSTFRVWKYRATLRIPREMIDPAAKYGPRFEYNEYGQIAFVNGGRQ